MKLDMPPHVIWHEVAPGHFQAALPIIKHPMSYTLNYDPHHDCFVVDAMARIDRSQVGEFAIRNLPFAVTVEGDVAIESTMTMTGPAVSAERSDFSPARDAHLVAIHKAVRNFGNLPLDMSGDQRREAFDTILKLVTTGMSKEVFRKFDITENQAMGALTRIAHYGGNAHDFDLLDKYLEVRRAS